MMNPAQLSVNDFYDYVESFMEDILNEHVRPISSPTVLSPFQNFHFHEGSKFDVFSNQSYLLSAGQGS